MLGIPLIAAAALAASPPPHADSARLLRSEARYASTYMARQMLGGFTERRATVRVDCHRVDRLTFMCSVRAEGQRASISFRVRIRYDDGEMVTGKGYDLIAW